MGFSIGNRLLGSTGLSNGFGLSVGNGLSFPGFGGAFSPAILFAAGEQGVWYDPSDMTTLFQNSAGTTPVTAVEQPVGRMLDKSGRGNHATQSIDAARPVLSARVNLLTKTEQFDDAAWTKSRVTVGVNAATAPDGTVTADVLRSTAFNDFHFVNQTINVSSIVNPSIKGVIYLKQGARGWAIVQIGANAMAASYFRYINLATGALGTIGGSSYSAESFTVTDASNGWWRINISATFAATATTFGLSAYTAANDNVGSFLGTGSDDLYLWGADLRVANDTALPVYQRVNTSTDYDTVGFPMYLRFDGSDDSMATSSINFTSTDEMTVFGGFRKNTEATASNVVVVTELSATTLSNNGSFVLYSSNGFLSPTITSQFNSRGTAEAASFTQSTAYSAPSTLIATGIADISADSVALRANGVQVNSSSTDQGTGNYGNYPLYIGSRGGTAFRFNGRIYSLIVRGAATTETLIGQTENWISGKMGGGYYPTGFDFLVDANGNQLTDASGNPLIAQALYS